MMYDCSHHHRNSSCCICFCNFLLLKIHIYCTKYWSSDDNHWTSKVEMYKKNEMRISYLVSVNLEHFSTMQAATVWVTFYFVLEFLRVSRCTTCVCIAKPTFFCVFWGIAKSTSQILTHYSWRKRNTFQDKTVFMREKWRLSSSLLLVIELNL